MANIIQTFPKGSGGGHTILNTDGTAVTQEKNLQFTGMSVTDDDQNELTEVAAEGLNEDSMADVLNGNIGNNFVTSGLNYSTDEQIVGRWIDGKPLYQKTMIMSSGYTSEIHVPNNATGVSVSGITDIFMSSIKPTLDKIVYSEMNANDRSYSGSSYHHSYPYRFNKDNGYIACVDNYMVGYQENIALYPGTAFTLRYTKSTD